VVTVYKIGNGPDRQAQLHSRPANNGQGNPYARLRRWAHMLGFGGHFLTKARRYSITFALLRTARASFRRAEDQQQAGRGSLTEAAYHGDQDTTLVIGALRFAAVGWRTTGDALLANTAAALARERRAAGREELSHELSTTLATGTVPAAA
jgi:hypothetical protein